MKRSASMACGLGALAAFPCFVSGTTGKDLQGQAGLVEELVRERQEAAQAHHAVPATATNWKKTKKAAQKSNPPPAAPAPAKAVHGLVICPGPRPCRRPCPRPAGPWR